MREGRLGRLQYLYSNRLNFGKIRREEDILWSFAPHDLSMILSLVGQEPDSVESVGSYYLHQRIADVTTTHLSFPGGERAHVFVSWLHPFKEQKLVVIGSEAMAVFDDGEPWERKLLLFPHRIKWTDGMPTPHKAEAAAVLLDPSEPLQAECEHFLDCVEIGATPRTDGREGLRVLSVLTRASERLHNPGAEPVRDLAQARQSTAARFPRARVHESAYVDDGVEIGDNTSIWHFSHILGSVKVGPDCVIGQNVAIGPNVTIGRHCKIQNNVSIYTGGYARGWRVLRTLLRIHQCQQSAGGDRTQARVSTYLGQAWCYHRRKCNHRMRPRARRVQLHCGGFGSDEGCTRVRPNGGRAGAPYWLDGASWREARRRLGLSWHRPALPRNRA